MLAVLSLIALILMIVVGGAFIGVALGILKVAMDVINAVLCRVNARLDAFNRRQADDAARVSRPVTTSVPITHLTINPWDNS